MTRYPFADLEAMLRIRPEYRGGHLEGVGAVARHLGVDRNMIYRWRHEGMGPLTADRVAISAGFHPSLVWSTWFDDALLEPGCTWCGGPMSLAPSTFGRGTTCSGRCWKARKRELAFIQRRHSAWLMRLDRYRVQHRFGVAA